MGVIDIVGSLLSIGSKVLDRLFPDPEQKAKAQLELLKLQQEGELTVLASDLQVQLAQAQINMVEAGNASIFVSGWRPCIGWVCAAAVAYSYILAPFGRMVVAAFWPDIKLPLLEMGDLMTLTLGMLGIGGFRTYEKVKGVAK